MHHFHRSALALPLLCAAACVTSGPATKGVTISPISAEVTVGGQIAFTATVNGLSDTAVSWSVAEETGGTVDANGLYTAPSRPGTFHVVATSVADSSYSSRAEVNVTSPTIAVGMGPHLATVAPGQTVLFTAGVSGLLPGDPDGVTFAVEEAGGGTIDQSGVYTAPAAPGEYHVVAKSAADVTKQDRATVVVQSAGVIPLERLTTWNPGLTAVGGIPQRSTICRALTPSGGDDTTAINAAIAACPKDQVVKLGAGTFKVSGEGVVMEKSNVVLRGAGPTQTRLTRTDTQDYTVIAIGRRYASGKLILPVNLSADGKKGSYGVTLASAPSPALTPGELVYLDQLTNPDLTHWGERSPPGHVSRSWFSRMDRPVTQILEVASVSGTAVRFTTPLHIDFLTAFGAQLVRHGEGGQVKPATRWVGVEDLTVEKGRGGDAGGNIHFFVAAYSWVKNVESTLSRGTSVNLDSSFRCEVRDSYIHTSGNPNPGGDGYLVGFNQGASDNLVENNVVWSGNKIVVMRASGGGNVFAYNLAQDAFGEGYPTLPEVGLNAAHMASAHHELFEGNESFNFDADAVWGNAVYITALRNNLTGLRTSKAPLQLTDSIARRAIGLTRWSWWYSFLGNVLGHEGQTLVAPQTTFVYEAKPGLGSPSGFADSETVPMWKLGYNGEDGSEFADPKVLSTTLRHGNFDYVTGQVKWDPSISTQAVPDSLYLAKKPAFFGDLPWPWVQPGAGSAAERTRTLPAKVRFSALP